MTSTTRRAAALLLVATLALAGCGDEQESPASAIPEAEPFNQADVDFATRMIPHHAEALQLVDTAAPRTGLSPELAALVEQIRSQQIGEVEQMIDWLEDWDQPVPTTSRDHGGGEGAGATAHADLPGMPTEEEIEALEAASGPEFEALWLEMMIALHEGAISLAQDEVDDGEYADAVSLAEGLTATQADQVEQMEQQLGD